MLRLTFWGECGELL